MAEPRRLKDRNAIEDAMCEKSTSESDEPSRMLPTTESAAPMRAQFRKAKVAPM
jgi:hypothetical protein